MLLQHNTDAKVTMTTITSSLHIEPGLEVHFWLTEETPHSTVTLRHTERSNPLAFRVSRTARKWRIHTTPILTKSAIMILLCLTADTTFPTASLCCMANDGCGGTWNQRLNFHCGFGTGETEAVAFL
jgi:hypothetical protein